MANLNLNSSETSLIGGVGMTRIEVYGQRPCPDGRQSGCPHFHAITTEAYYILDGKGEVEFHDIEKGFYTIDLNKGDYVQFPPGVIHRLINIDGLNILGIMGNAGLAENGDARIYFGKEIDEDEARYKECIALVKNGIEGALDRRDLAVKGYFGLMDLWENDRDAYFIELKRFISSHQKNVKDNISTFEPFIQNGPAKWGAKTDSILESFPDQPKTEAMIQNSADGDVKFGMCGILKPIHTE